MCIIIGDLHKFFGHCLIPLDSWEREEDQLFIQIEFYCFSIFKNLKLKYIIFNPDKLLKLKHFTIGQLQCILAYRWSSVLYDVIFY